MTEPRVSVCMPAYNSARYLSEAIDSVLAQQDCDFELLIIDDCSTDETGEIAKRYADQERRIRYLSNKQNVGMVNNWNSCLELARGEYIKYLFSDDFLTSPDALSRMAAVLDTNPAVSLVSTARNIVNEDSKVVKQLTFFPEGFTAKGIDLINLCFAGMLREHNIIGEPSAVMFRRCQGMRGFDTRYRQLVDLEMWFHLLEQGDYVHLGGPLCAFRIHDDQQTQVNVAALRHIDDIGLMFKEYLEKKYIRLGYFTRRYFVYYQYYKLWKHARQGKYDPAQAREKIKKGYGMGRFILAIPLYKLYNPFFQLLHGKRKGK
jgi:glycosyltransferase involved in cell wall biosynthesis